jgi:hypothetical protein
MLIAFYNLLSKYHSALTPLIIKKPNNYCFFLEHKHLTPPIPPANNNSELGSGTLAPGRPLFV